jgi:hypothetical protein
MYIKTLFLILFISATAAELLTARAGSNPLVDYVAVTKSEVTYVPTLSDLSIDRLIPAGNFFSAARYKIHLTFDRGCLDTNDRRFGNAGFLPLDCVYNNTHFIGCFSGTSTVADPAFVPGNKIYFVSGVKFWMELLRGIRADASILKSRITTDAGYCETFNDQTQVVDNIVFNWLVKNYYDIAQYYTDDILFAANVEAFEYIGLPTVIAYFFLGDPDVSDAFETLNTTLLYTMSSGNVVLAAYNMTIRSLQLPEGQNIYWDTQIQQTRFNEYNKIYEHRIFVDGAKVLAFYPSIQNPNITKTCTTIQEYCVGPLEQYPTFEACVSFMESIPLLKGYFAQSVAANEVGCREFHSNLLYAPGAPPIHCTHTGPYNAAITMGQAGLAVTPCIDETGPYNPLPLAPTARRTQRHLEPDTDYSYACSDLEWCKYKRGARQSKDLLWSQVAFSQTHEALIGLAGALIQAGLDAN